MAGSVNEFKIYGNVEFMPFWDKTTPALKNGDPIYGEPFIGVEIVVVDPNTNQVIEHLDIYTDDQGYFEFYKPIHWSGSLAVYRPATGEVLGYHTLLGGGYPEIEDLTQDFFVEGPGSGYKCWVTGYVNMEPYIKGKVIDSAGNPVEGIIVETNHDVWDVTDEKGEYTIIYPIFFIEDITLTPINENHPGATFSPAKYYYPIFDRDFLDQDFVMVEERKIE